MSLLREIQSSAIDASIPLATLLRKCKILAARLANDEFKDWIDNELSGYKSREDLPAYRIVKVNSKGHFFGDFQSGMRNADIPMACMPKEFREVLSHAYLMSPVAAMEDLANRSQGGVLSEPWNPDIVAHFGGDIYAHMNCLQAWKVISVSSIVAALDTIRTRVLNFVLDIEAEAPAAGEAPINSSPVPQERLHQIFNTNIYGNVQNLANASSGISQKATYNEQHADLFSALLLAIEQSGAPANIIAIATEGARGMGQSSTRDSFRENYLKFMSVVSDHMQVIGVAVAPFLPQLGALLG